jgi:8-oxo-dGTP pyrophosphatase MutT (NUDIX family)
MTTETQPAEVPAATVVLGRDTSAGLEVLMLKRTSGASFAAGAWVFPGGRVDSVDAGSDSLDSLAAARRAAVRETEEEAGIRMDGAQLSAMSRLSPRPEAPKRFLTWMLFGRAAETADVVVDRGEIVDHRWISPAEAMRAHGRGKLVLLPPTWVTLFFLARHNECATAIAAVRSEPVAHFQSRPARTEDGPVVLWHGDAGYATREAAVPGNRHWLVMKPGGWRYERGTAGHDSSVH